MVGLGWSFVLLGCRPSEPGGACTEKSFWSDLDGDGYGASGEPIVACVQPAGSVLNADDCDDARAEAHPGAIELCNDIDDDCDGIGDGPTVTWYPDADGDGYGNWLEPNESCVQMSGMVTDATDCNDADETAHPGAEEQCDDEDDDDCDGVSDVGEVRQFWADDDGDFYGDPDTSVTTCEPDPTWVDNDLDCDPHDAAINPGEAEVCNDVDDNCDGMLETCAFVGEFDLGDARAKYTATPTDDAGRLVDAGDLDGDGDEDIVVATLYAYNYGGGGWIIESPPPSGVAAFADVGHEVVGSNETYGAGRSIGVGDADDDGFEDVIFGAPYSPGGNEAFVLWGPVTGDVTLVDASVRFVGTNGTYFGHGSDLADVTGDGIADVLVGAYYTDGGRGTLFVVNGPVTDGEFSLVDDATATLHGDSANQCTGRAVRGGLDMDGDGVGDIVVPATFDNQAATYAGKVFVVHGPVEGDLQLSAADAVLVGPEAYAYFGTDIAQGDVDGDGLYDAIIGSPGVGGGNGAVFWVTGPASGEIAAGDADGYVLGTVVQQQVGFNVDARDTDGDGRAEVLVGAAYDAEVGNNAGKALLFYGPVEAGTRDTDAAATFIAESGGDYVGSGVAFADVDGDAKQDLLIGAPGEATGGPSSGAVYVLSPE